MRDESNLLRILRAKRSGPEDVSSASLAHTFLAVGNEYFDEGHFRYAHLCFDASLRLNPTQAVSWSNCASALLKLGRHHEALEMAMSATRRQATFEMAHVHAGNAQLALGRTLSASKSFSRILLLSSGSMASAYAALAKVGLERIEAFQRACLDAKRAIDAGNAAGALRHAEAALEIAPSAPRARAVQAEALAQSNACAAALALCEAALPLEWLPASCRRDATAAASVARLHPDGAPHDAELCTAFAMTCARSLARLGRRRDATALLTHAVAATTPDAPQLRAALERLERVTRFAAAGDRDYKGDFDFIYRYYISCESSSPQLTHSPHHI